MKKTSRIIKGTVALIFAALMVTSFGGCSKAESSSTAEQNNSSVSTAVESSATSESKIEAALVEVKNEEYTVLDGDDGNLGVYGITGNGNLCNIPSNMNGRNVTEIEARSFMGKDVVEVNIPDTVKLIKSKAFYDCKLLEKVTFGKNIEVMQESSFYKCTALKEITITDVLEKINVATFLECTSLEKVTIGSNVKEIDETAFAKCTSLKEVHMGDLVTYIAGKDVSNPAFEGCDNMTIYAPAGSYAESFAKENNIPFVAE